MLVNTISLASGADRGTERLTIVRVIASTGSMMRCYGLPCLTQTDVFGRRRPRRATSM